MSDHIERLRETENADTSIKNWELVNGNQNTTVFERVKNCLPDNRRSNAVLAVEHLMTASPEFFKGKNEFDIRDWAMESIAWAEAKYGRENVVSAKLHRDEITPHLHLVVVPKVGGKLNARSFFGGREKLTKMQDSYANTMKRMSLERGVKGSKAKHNDIKQFYAIVNDTPKKIKEANDEKPTRNGAFDIGFEKRMIDWYKNRVMPIALVNIDLLKAFTAQSGAVVKASMENEIDDNLKQINKLSTDLSRAKKALEDKSGEVKSLSDLTRKQAVYLQNIEKFVFSKTQTKTLEEAREWLKNGVAEMANKDQGYTR